MRNINFSYPPYKKEIKEDLILYTALGLLS